ncbi:MAG: glutathione transferase [Kofleriaceae bacterium]
MPADTKAELAKHALIGKVPVLAHGKLWISESLAISEYLAEMFPAPAHPRLFPADLGDRARARQVMSAMRTSLMGLREDRPTSSVFGRPIEAPLSERGRRDADELLELAGRLVTPGQALFGAWCIADADLTLMLMRLVANGDPVPQPIVDYAVAQWDRKSIRQYLSYLPTVT